MTGRSTKQAGAPHWSALQRWTLGVTSMAAFMAGMAGEEIARLITDPGHDYDAYLLGAAGLSPAP